MFLRTEKIICALLWLVMAGFSVWGHMILPDAPVAMHFGFDGTANGFMPRDQAMIVMPGLALVLMVLLLWLLPAVMPKSGGVQRSAAAYGPVTLGAMLLLVTIQIAVVLKAAGTQFDMLRLVSCGVGLVVIVIGNYLPKTRLNWLMGVRTPWTLSDERVWDRTHRFAGPLFMVAGFVILVGAFVVPVTMQVWLLLPAMLVPAVVSVVYSWLVARSLKLA